MSRLVSSAARERLGLQLGYAIVQKVVLTILDNRRGLDESEMLFLVTNSPVWDVSDAIINKYAPEYPEAEPDGPLLVRLERVQRFLCEAIGLREIEAILVSMSVGEDPDYVEATISASQFAQKSLPYYEDEPEAPTVRFRIRAV